VPRGGARGGRQDFVAGELGCSQSRVSDYCSRNTRDFMPADKAAVVEALGAGAPGHPHITRALARAQGMVLTDPVGVVPASLAGVLGAVAGESSDVIGALARLASGGLATIDALALDPAVRAALAGEIDQLIDLLVSIAARLVPERDTS
jgi:hypothetical protein